MKTEIKLILDETSSNKAKGNCFERLIRDLLHNHQYKIRQNLRMTGMEIDLIAEHKHRDNEILYVECKAKEKVSSIELRTFFANVYHNKADFGYFFRTKELEYDAGGLLNEYRTDSRYNNLTFFEPDDIVNMLKDGEFIYEPLEDISKLKISKKILVVSYFGDFFVYIINESNLLPTSYSIVDAQKNSKPISKSSLNIIKNKIQEITGLNPYKLKSSAIKQRKLVTSFGDNNFETVSEVQASENWYDFLPASSKDFVGRISIKKNLLSFIKEIQEEKTSKRVFYLKGKSGWGKSSLICEIRDKFENKYYRNKFCCLAIDTRSAISGNFVALSFEKLLKKATDNDFINSSLFNENLNFTSNIDLLSSNSVTQLLEDLKRRNRYLILIFDQFEDVFKKPNLFKSFYKFLTDVTDAKANIIIGFSWKTEIVIPIEHEAYSFWQQAKSQAREFEIGEFGGREINGIIGQLEKSVGKLDRITKNRIKDNSQGLPWLTKKFCIHIYNQIESGISKSKLIESNLNVIDLFEKDKEEIKGDELIALKLIARKAHEGVLFDVSEIGETVSNNTIESLLNKRLIIRSGVNYTTYWDVFRDYLLTGKVPILGESYFLAQAVIPCFNVFQLFEARGRWYSTQELYSKYQKNIKLTSFEFILMELMYIGILKKDGDLFSVSEDVIDLTRDSFVNHITKKFKVYKPYLLLKRKNLKVITKKDINDVLKETFKNEYKEATWYHRTNTLIRWFAFSDIGVKVEDDYGKLETKGLFNNGRGISSFILKRDKEKIYIKSSINEVLQCMQAIELGKKYSHRYFRDLFVLGIIDEEKELTPFGLKVRGLDIEAQSKELKSAALKFPKMKLLKKLIEENKGITAKELRLVLPSDFLYEITSDNSKNVYCSKLLNWFSEKEGRLTNEKILKNRNTIYIKSSLNDLLKCLKSIRLGKEYSYKYKRDLFALGVLNEEKELTKFGLKLSGLNVDDQIDELRKASLEFPKMELLKRLIEENKIIKSKDLIRILPLGFLNGLTAPTTRKIYCSRLLNWFN